VPGERSLRADRGGRFCVDFESQGPDAFGGTPEPPVDVELRYSDARGLVDAAVRRVSVDRNRRGIELRFVDPPSSIDLDVERARVEIGVRAEPPVPSRSTLPILLVARSEGADRVVGQIGCVLGATAEFSIPTSELGPPGPVDLVARFSGTDSFQPAETVRRLSRVARVTLSLAHPPKPSDPESGVTLDLAVGSSRGAVGSGSVEARLDGETVGIAKVDSGTARVIARFSRRPGSRAGVALHPRRERDAPPLPRREPRRSSWSRRTKARQAGAASSAMHTTRRPSQMRRWP
jgi:hypothetical protein